MKSELLKQAMMAKYQDGGKVKKEPKKVASESELPKGGTWETDASGKKFYVVRSKDKTKGDSGKEKLKTYSGAKKRIPTNWKIEPTKSETEERFYLEPPVTKEPTQDPFNLAFGWAGAKKETTNEGVAANMPRVMINGKPTQIREWTIPGQFDEKTKTWNTASGAMNPTKVYGYYGANNEFIPVDVNKTQKLSYDPTGKPYYDPKDVVAPPTWTTAAKNEGSLRALDSEAIKKTQLANEEQRKNYLKSGEVAPPVQVKNVISPTNFNESGLSIGKDVELKTKAQGIVPTQGVNTPTVGQYDGKLEPLVHPKFKKGGLVGKYASGGPILNPYINKGIKDINKLANQPVDQNNPMPTTDAPKGLSKLNTAQTGNAFSALGQLGGTGVDALDRKDGRSSIAGQAVAGALKGAGQGAAIGSMIPGVGTVGGAVIGAGIGAIAGGIRGKKEKQERIDATADDVRNNVASQQYSDSKATFKSDLYNEKDYNKGLKGLFAKGGTIKGAGTGTSDSIKTKIGKEGIEENSFIVPAKNNGLAKLIRKEVLEDSPNKEAKFKKGGNANIAVSNGEHLFTPAEKKKITAYLGQEILEKLAPEAEESEDKKCGGMVRKYGDGGKVGNTTKRMYATGNEGIDAEIDNLYKTGNWRKESVQQVLDKANQLGVQTKNADGFYTGAFNDITKKQMLFDNAVSNQLESDQKSGLVKKTAANYAKLYNELQKRNKSLNEASKNTINYTPEQLKKLKEDKDKAESAVSKYEGLVSNILGSDYAKTFKKTAANYYAPKTEVKPAIKEQVKVQQNTQPATNWEWSL